MAMIIIDGVNLEVQRIGSDKVGPPNAPLVFLHEGLGSVALWRDWPAQVCAATGRVGYCYSRRGYGQSDPVKDVRGVGRLQPDYMHVEAWEVLPKLLHALQIEKPVLVGHSDGGSIALLHASRFEVSGVAVLAPHLVVEAESIASITQAAIAYQNGDLRSRLSPYHADVDGAFWQWNDVWLSEGFSSFDIREACRTINAPVLAVQGTDDPYGTMFQIDEIASLLGNKTPSPTGCGPVQLQKFENCGHSPHRDQAAKTTRVIADFLKHLP